MSYNRKQGDKARKKKSYDSDKIERKIKKQKKVSLKKSKKLS